MPPRWPREPDPLDPAYRRLEDRINFAFHVALFSAVNSGIWFFAILRKADWPWAVWTTGTWTTLLLAHLVYIALIAKYSTSGIKPD
jgi:hypothetical protein